MVDPTAMYLRPMIALVNELNRIFAEIDSGAWVENQPTIDVLLARLNARRDAKLALAQNDFYTVATDKSFDITTADLMANDTQQPGVPVTLNPPTAPKHGTLTSEGNGVYRYQPTSGYKGFDSFTYTLTDGEATSAPATVTLRVSDPEDLNGDCRVDKDDLAVLMDLIKNGSYAAVADINHDGKVDVLDARLFVLKCPNPRCAPDNVPRCAPDNVH